MDKESVEYQEAKSLQQRILALEEHTANHSRAMASTTEITQKTNAMVIEINEKILAVMAAIEKRMAFAARLEAYFGPLMDGKNPPIDGEQIATKAYVDDAAARVSRRLREHIDRVVAAVAATIPKKLSLLKSLAEVGRQWKAGGRQ